MIGIATSCTTQNLDFVRDDRISIVSPGEAEPVTLPLTVSWELDADQPLTVAVFLDRAPIRPGQHLDSLVPRDDHVCRDDERCPDDAWFEARGVHVTDGTEITIDSIVDRRASGRQQDRHELVIVFIDEGRRVGEAAIGREFTVAR